MTNVYEIIDDLRKAKHWSMRTLANLAGIAPTTFVSMMKRKADKISIPTLSRIAAVFGAEWYELLTPDPYTGLRDIDPATRVYTEVPEQEKMWIINNVLSRPTEPVLPLDVAGRGIAPMEQHMQAAKYSADDLLFRQSIDFFLNQLNTRGLREAMHQLLIIANDPNNTSKEDNLCHEDEPPTAQVCNPESAQTDAGNAGTK